jgi:hypothetical protein
MATKEELLKSLHRIQEAKNIELPTLLSSILPQLIPLTNQENIRSDVIQVLTEALRRIKLSSSPPCLLSVDIFIDLLHSSHLPFSVNFSIAFLDSLSERNYLIGFKNVNNIYRLLSNLLTFEIFSYQSNSLCYYLFLIYCEVEANDGSVNIDIYNEALGKFSLSDQKKLLEIMFDFYIDILLFSFPVVSSTPSSSSSTAVAATASSTIIPSGLSQNRINRIIVKKKIGSTLTAPLLLQWKMKIMMIVNHLTIRSKYQYLTAFIACSYLKENNDIQSSGKRLLNILKDVNSSNDFSKLTTDEDFSSDFLVQFCFSFSSSSSSSSSIDDSSNLLFKDRTSLPKDLQLFALDYLKNNSLLSSNSNTLTSREASSLLQFPSISVLFSVYQKLTKQLTIKHFDEMNDKILKLISELILLFYEKKEAATTSSVISDSRLELIPSVINQIMIILSSYAYSYSTSSVTASSSVIIDLKNVQYDLLYVFLVNYHIALLSKYPELISLLLRIAGTDHTMDRTSLYKLLEEIQNHWKEEEISPSSSFFLSLETQIKSLKENAKSSCRLLYLKWIKRLYGGWNSFVLKEIWSFSGSFLLFLVFCFFISVSSFAGCFFLGDKTEIVSNYCKRQLNELKSLIKENQQNQSFLVNLLNNLIRGLLDIVSSSLSSSSSSSSSLYTILKSSISYQCFCCIGMVCCYLTDISLSSAFHSSSSSSDPMIGYCSFISAFLLNKNIMGFLQLLDHDALHQFVNTILVQNINYSLSSLPQASSSLSDSSSSSSSSEARTKRITMLRSYTSCDSVQLNPSLLQEMISEESIQLLDLLSFLLFSSLLMLNINESNDDSSLERKSTLEKNVTTKISPLFSTNKISRFFLNNCINLLLPQESQSESFLIHSLEKTSQEKIINSLQRNNFDLIRHVLQEKSSLDNEKRVLDVLTSYLSYFTTVYDAVAVVPPAVEGKENETSLSLTEEILICELINSISLMEEILPLVQNTTNVDCTRLFDSYSLETKLLALVKGELNKISLFSYPFVVSSSISCLFRCYQLQKLLSKDIFYRLFTLVSVIKTSSSALSSTSQSLPENEENRNNCWKIIYFTIANLVTSMISFQDEIMNDIRLCDLFDNLLLYDNGLLSLPKGIASSISSQKNEEFKMIPSLLEEKQCLASIILTLLKSWVSFSTIGSVSSVSKLTIRFHSIERILKGLLYFLRINNPFLRDITTLGLIHLYLLCKGASSSSSVDSQSSIVITGLEEGVLTLPSSSSSSSSSTTSQASSTSAVLSLEEYISKEIIISITRKKRPLQRLGFDVLSSGNRNNNATAVGSAGGGETSNNRNNTNNNRNDGGDQQGRERTREEELLEAANAMNIDEIVGMGGIDALLGRNQEANTNNDNAAAAAAEELDNGFRIYEKVCNIAKKVRKKETSSSVFYLHLPFSFRFSLLSSLPSVFVFFFLLFR